MTSSKNLQKDPTHSIDTEQLQRLCFEVANEIEELIFDGDEMEARGEIGPVLFSLDDQLQELDERSKYLGLRLGDITCLP